MPVRAPVTEPRGPVRRNERGNIGRQAFAETGGRKAEQEGSPRAGESGVGSNAGPICFGRTTESCPFPVRFPPQFAPAWPHSAPFPPQFVAEPFPAIDQPCAPFGTVRDSRVKGLANDGGREGHARRKDQQWPAPTER